MITTESWVWMGVWAGALLVGLLLVAFLFLALMRMDMGEKISPTWVLVVAWVFVGSVLVICGILLWMVTEP